MPCELPNELVDLVLQHSDCKQLIDSRLLSKSLKERIDTGVPHQYKLITNALGIEPRNDRPLTRELDQILKAEDAIRKGNFGRSPGKRSTLHLPEGQAFVRGLIAPVNDKLIVAGEFIGEDHRVNGGPIATSVEMYRKGDMIKMWDSEGFQYQNWRVDVAGNVVALIGDLRETMNGETLELTRAIICLRADDLTRYNPEPILLRWDHTDADIFCRVSIRSELMTVIQISDEDREYRGDTCRTIEVYRWRTNEKVAQVVLPKHHRLFSAEIISSTTILVGCGLYAGDLPSAALLRYDLQGDKLVHISTYEYPPLRKGTFAYDCVIRCAPVSLDNKTDGNRLKDGEGVLHITFLRISIPEPFPAAGNLPQRNVKGEVALISSFTGVVDDADRGKTYRWEEWMPQKLSTTRSMPRIQPGCLNGYRLITQCLKVSGDPATGTLMQINDYNPSSVRRQQAAALAKDPSESATEVEIMPKSMKDMPIVKADVDCFFPHLKKRIAHPQITKHVETITIDHDKIMVYEIEQKGDHRPTGVYITTLFREAYATRSSEALSPDVNLIM